MKTDGRTAEDGGDGGDEEKKVSPKIYSKCRMLHTVRCGALSFRRSDGNRIFYFIAFCSNQLILNRFSLLLFSRSCRLFSVSFYSHSIHLCERALDFFDHRNISDDTQWASDEMIKFNSFPWPMVNIIVSEWPSWFGVSDARTHTRTHSARNQCPKAKGRARDTSWWNTIEFENSGQTGC